MDDKIKTKELTIAQLQKQSYKLACEKGWHDQERIPLEYHMLIVSEIAEATEEARAGTEPIWYNNQHIGGKDSPQGELIELADAVIRIADYAESRGENLGDGVVSDIEYPFDISNNPLVSHMEIINQISCASMSHMELHVIFDDEFGFLIGAINLIAGYCLSRGWDLTAAINIKHEYNKTRPYRHGGKLY